MRFLQTGIDGFTFKRQNPEDCFVDSAQGFLAYESLEGFDAQSELAESQRSFGGESTRAQPLQVFRGRVFGAVN
jgi:hypothetical protein